MNVKPYPFIDPVIFKIGFFELRWYSVSYILAFLLSYLLLLWLNQFSKKEDLMPKQKADHVINYCILGVILGGRLGYVLFYDPLYYFANPSKILAIWEGGMSFHGGLLGVIIAMIIFAKKEKYSLVALGDKAAVCALPGLFFGRLANFINGELWGKPTGTDYGYIFAMSGDLVNRHPSQLYEALAEGLLPFIIFFILLKFTKLFHKRGIFAGIFLLNYSIFRFIIEAFFREPHGTYNLTQNVAISTGQLLCIPMFLLGVCLILKAKKV